MTRTTRTTDDYRERTEQTYNRGQKSLGHFVLAFYVEVARNQQFTLIEMVLERFSPAPPKQC